MEIYQQINQYVNEKNNEKVIEISEQYLNSIDTTQNPTKETEDVFIFYINAKANKENAEQIIEMFTKIYGKDKICSRDTTIMYVNALIVCEKIDLATAFILKHIVKISTLEDPNHKQTIEKLYELLKSIKIDNATAPQIIENVNNLLEDTITNDDISEEIKQQLNEIKEFKGEEEEEEDDDESENDEKEIILTESNELTSQVTYNIDVDTIDNEPLSNEGENNEIKENKPSLFGSIYNSVASGVSSICGKVKDTFDNMSTNQKVGAAVVGLGVVITLGYVFVKKVNKK